ncbi:hypothetical protein PCC9214_05353 [Planktothrix tepida]|uniref:hypothetical protein n=1 Tax=Planktothrix tepida TaxID=1678309 RepID=UPI0020B2D417|nr:hypothetical protein [Planktothrix tepida]CAD5985177.1 hypothetical protein PCC9214_05353 [Planktothrix tepida]
MKQARISDLFCLGLIAFNLALAIHFAVNNWIFTLLIIGVSVPISIIFLVGAENKEKTTDDEQTKIIFTSATSIVGDWWHGS